MPWPQLVLDCTRHQLPHPGARCIPASRRASTVRQASTVIACNVVGSTVVACTVVTNTVVTGTVTGDSGLLWVTLIRRETFKACTRPVQCWPMLGRLTLGTDGSRIRLSAGCGQLREWRSVRDPA